MCHIPVSFLMHMEALESVMCDVIKMRLKRRDATRSKIKCKLKIKFGIPPLTLAALQLF